MNSFSAVYAYYANLQFLSERERPACFVALQRLTIMGRDWLRARLRMWVARLMLFRGLQAHWKRRFKRTTDSHHAWPVARNVIDRDFAANAPDEKWTVDISYVWTAEGWLYLAIVVDLFSRRIVGWSTSDRLKRGLIEALPGRLQG